MQSYIYVSQNPINLIDPTGMIAESPLADFYDFNGNYLGTDGVDDGKVYVLNSKKRARFENKAVNWGGKLQSKYVKELKAISGLAITPGKISYSLDKGEDPSSDKYNQYDSQLAAMTYIMNTKISRGELEIGDYEIGENAPTLDVNLVKALAYKESRLGQGVSTATYPSDIFSMFHPRDYGDKGKLGMTMQDVLNGKEASKNGGGTASSIKWGIHWLYYKGFTSPDGKVKNFQGWEQAIHKYGPGKIEPTYKDTVLKIYNSIK